MYLADLYRKVRWFVRAKALACRGVEFGQGVLLGDGVQARLGFNLGHRGQIIVGPRNRWEKGVIVNAHGGTVQLGPSVYLGPYTIIYGHGNVTIGDSCLIAAHCQILSSNHTIPPRGTDICTQPDILLPTRIGRDVWLGAGVTVLGGVTIGDGCVVGAGSVVTSDLPPNSIAVGVPARVLRERP